MKENEILRDSKIIKWKGKLLCMMELMAPSPVSFQRDSTSFIFYNRIRINEFWFPNYYFVLSLAGSGTSGLRFFRV